HRRKREVFFFVWVLQLLLLTRGWQGTSKLQVSVGGKDADLQHAFLLGRSSKLDGEQPIVQLGLADLNAVGERESPLELARGDAAMEIVLSLVVALPPPHGENAIFDADLELVAREAGDGKGDAQGLRLVDVSQQLDIVRRIARLRTLSLSAHLAVGRE